MITTFKDILIKYLQIKSISNQELAKLLGDTTQSVSRFLNKKDTPPQLRTKLKYFEKLPGFEDFYNKETTLTIDVGDRPEGPEIPKDVLHRVLFYVSNNMDALRESDEVVKVVLEKVTLQARLALINEIVDQLEKENELNTERIKTILLKMTVRK